jgi:2-polyprenyl-6-methoxyphenol hydroxylase-like FAD-dependent oxidoreductase
MINIIGGGIAGMTTAIVLSKAGIKSEIFEMKKKGKIISGSITLSPNSIRIFKKIDCYRSIINQGWVINYVNFIDEKLTLLCSRELGNEKIYGEPTIGIKRQSLIDILYSKTVDNIIHYNYEKQVYDYYFNKNFSVIADGNSSINRLKINSKYIRKFSKIVYFGGYIYCTKEYLDYIISLLKINNFNQSVIINRSSFIGFSIINSEDNLKAIYWYTHIKSEKPLTNDELSTIRKNIDISRVVNSNLNLPMDILNCIKLTNEIVTSNIYETFIDKLCYSDDFIIIGDAAHSINPLSGQGAGMAIEDAYIFGNFIARNFEKIKNKTKISNDLKKLYDVRDLRISKIQRRANLSCKINALVLPKFLYYIRNKLFALQTHLISDKYNNAHYYDSDSEI